MTTQNSLYKAIDYAKFIFSILVIALHCGPFECVSADASYYFTQCVTRVAVPFFFVCNGFFAFTPREYNWKTVAKQCKKLIRMYCIWTIIYFPGFVSAYDTLKEAAVAFILGHGYAHLWYLAAAAVAIFMFYIIKTRCVSWKKIFALAGALYLFGLSYDSYYAVFRRLPIWNVPLIHTVARCLLSQLHTTRDGVFFGFLFVAIGAYIAENKQRINKRLCAKGFMISAGAAIVEVVAVRALRWQRRTDAVDLYVFLIPMATFLFCYLLCSNSNSKKTSSNIRKESTIIYLVHIWVRTIYLRIGVPVLSNLFGEILAENSFLIFCIDVLGSIMVAKVLIIASKTQHGRKIYKWLF